MSARASAVFFKFFKNAGSRAMNVNGSVTPVNFDIAPVATDRDELLIRRINVVIIDGGITPVEFGGITALTNGVRIVVLDKNGTELLDFLDGDAIKKNADWVLLAGIDNPVTNAAGDDEFAVRWTLANGLGLDGLRLEKGHTMRVIVRDNLAALTSFRMFAQGRQGRR